jgi:antitoxin ParD1/3/4
MPKKEGPYMTLISMHVPKPVVDALDELVRLGIAPNRSEAIRQAINEYLAKYLCYYVRLKEVREGGGLSSEEESFFSMLIKGR